MIIMTAITKLKMDLAEPELLPEVYLVQDDRYSRSLDISLYCSGIALAPPEGCTVLIRYNKPDGKGGTYDTMPDGTPAFAIRDNVVRLRLAPQVCGTAGKVTLMATLFCGDGELNSFSLSLNVLARHRGIPDSRLRQHHRIPASARRGPGGAVPEGGLGG